MSAASGRKKNLRGLLAGLTAVIPPDIEIGDLTLDSRQVTPGAAFVALPGLRTHGISFANQAVASGAAAMLWEPTADTVVAPSLPANIASVAIPNLTSIVGVLADRFFDEPSKAVSVAGITGTNGKTTTAYVVAAALAALGRSAAYAGTLGFGPVNAIKPGTHTTPDSITVHRQIAALRDANCSHLAIEVSSHALDQQRVAGVRFHTALFTNLTHDHLDYHGTFEAYGAAKAKLFSSPQLQHAVINIDDAFGRNLALTKGTAIHTTVIAAQPIRDFAPDRVRHLFADRVTATAGGLQIGINGAWGASVLRSRFVGAFNVDNLLASLAVLLGYDIPLDAAVAALEQCVPPPGRMETFSVAGHPLAVVDYAHTPDALQKALLAVRAHCKGKLICVFGCGGDRDAKKRPVMGGIAERFADRLIVTDDNPRTEDGDAIVADILNGIKSTDRVLIERDRAIAIERAIREAGPNDAVLIAGKGHEDYQIVGLVARYFSDRDVVQATMRRHA